MLTKEEENKIDLFRKELKEIYGPQIKRDPITLELTPEYFYLKHVMDTKIDELVDALRTRLDDVD